MPLPLAFGDVKCPEISVAAQYTSPVTKAKKITCGYMKNNRFIKHGQEIEFDKADNISKTKFYSHDKLIEEPEAEKDSFNVIQELMRIFPYEKSGAKNKLKINTCDTDEKTWVKVVTTSNAVQKTYAFNKQCDLSGTFTASLLEEFPVHLEVKNLYGFERTSMRVRMSIDQHADGIRYQFEVREGAVMSKDKTISFTVRYEVKIDPLTGSTMFDSQKGTISLTKVGQRFLKLSKPLLFTR